MVVIVVTIALTLAWRKSSKIERQLQEQNLPAIDVDEFFKGRPIIPKYSLNASELENASLQKSHYMTLEDINTKIEAERRVKTKSSNKLPSTNFSDADAIDIALSQPYKWKWEISKTCIKKCNYNLN